MEEMEWRERFERAVSLLSKVWDFAYRYDVEFDTMYRGKKCKLVVYQEKDGEVFVALTNEAYEKALELSESEDKKVREVARAVVNYVKMFIELFDVLKVRAILERAKDLPRSTKIEDGKIKTVIEGVRYELDEEEVRELAYASSVYSKDIRRYYEEILRNEEKKRRIGLEDRLWKEIERNWVRRTLLGNIIWVVGVGRGEGRGGFYYAVDMDILPRSLKEKVKEYAVFLKDTRGIRDIDSSVFPGFVKSSRLPPGWYIPEGNVDKVREILMREAKKVATDEDIAIVKQYKELVKED